MKYKPVRDRCCQNEECQDHGKFGIGNITRHSKYKTGQGRRRRYLCKTCKKTFCSTKGTPYYRLHKPRSDFDEVVQMTVEGVGISSISRIKCFSWNTIASWQYLACQVASEYNNQKLKGAELIELQADEIRTFAGTKKKSMWIFVAIEVWSRLWISRVIGSRNYRNIKTLLNQVIEACRIVNPFIFTTDGFEPYSWAARNLLDSICLYAQVIKKRRKNRVIKVEMCYYNFVRPHSALKFGEEMWTPAMQAGLVKKQLSFREIFTTVQMLFWWFSMHFRIRVRVEKFSWSSAQ